MNENNRPNLQQLLSNKKALEQVTNSPDAKALAELLTKGQDQASLQKIAQDAANGNTAQLRELIHSITSTPGGTELLRRLSQSIEGK